MSEAELVKARGEQILLQFSTMNAGEARKRLAHRCAHTEVQLAKMLARSKEPEEKKAGKMPAVEEKN